MGAFDAIPGSMHPPSARHLKPGVKAPTEVDTLLQASGRLLLCGINSVCPDLTL
jgi:fatty acid synthase